MKTAHKKKEGPPSIEFISLPDGKQVKITCDKKGKNIVENQALIEVSEEAKELVESAELLSRKRKKNHITSIQKQRGE